MRWCVCETLLQKHHVFEKHFYYLCADLCDFAVTYLGPDSHPSGPADQIHNILQGEELRGFWRWGLRGPMAAHKLGGCGWDCLLLLIPTDEGQEVWAQSTGLLQTIRCARARQLEDRLPARTCCSQMSTSSTFAVTCWWRPTCGWRACVFSSSPSVWGLTTFLHCHMFLSDIAIGDRLWMQGAWAKAWVAPLLATQFWKMYLSRLVSSFVKWAGLSSQIISLQS